MLRYVMLRAFHITPATIVVCHRLPLAFFSITVFTIDTMEGRELPFAYAAAIFAIRLDTPAAAAATDIARCGHAFSFRVFLSDAADVFQFIFTPLSPDATQTYR